MNGTYIATYWKTPSVRRYRVQTYTGHVVKDGFRSVDEANRFLRPGRQPSASNGQGRQRT